MPEGLAEMPPGPALATALAGIDLAGVPNDEMLTVLRAQHRQLCHDQARFARALVEVDHCTGEYEPGQVARRDTPNPYGPEETRAALAWTGSAAYAEHALAGNTMHAMPLVWASWWAGELDRPRVRIFDRYLAGLDPELVREVCEVTVARAPRLTTGQLDALLRRLVIAADPAAADRWYRRGLRDRDVTAYIAPDGTVTMTATGLPTDEAEAACRRVQDLAHAARRAGHRGRIGVIRSQVFLGLLDGRFHGMTVGEIVAALVAQADPAPTADPAHSAGSAGSDVGAGRVTAPDRRRDIWDYAGDGRSTAGSDGAQDPTAGPACPAAGLGGPGGAVDTLVEGGPAEGDAAGEPGRAAVPDRAAGGAGSSEPVPHQPVPDEPDPPQPVGTQPVGTQPVETQPVRTGPVAPGPVPDEPDQPPQPVGTRPVPAGPVPTQLVSNDRGPDDRGPGPGPGPDSLRGPVDDRRGIEIRIALSTLLGHDEHPADLPGLGPLLAGPGRARVALQHRARWRFAVTDPDGHLLTEGLTRRRPRGPRPQNGPRGGIVELHVPETLLTALVADPAVAGDWAPVVADIAAQHADRAAHLAEIDANPDRRLPGPALRRHSQIRDRTCTHPCCRRPAESCDQDHSRDYATGGRTVRANTGPACGHDHSVKHDGGWKVEQPEAGRFIWRSPLGGAYPSRGQFLDPPLPTPVEHHDADEDPDDDRPRRYVEGPILRRPERPEGADRWRAPPPEPITDDIPPPF